MMVLSAYAKWYRNAPDAPSDTAFPLHDISFPWSAFLDSSFLIFSQRVTKLCCAGLCFVVMLSRRQTLSCPSTLSRSRLQLLTLHSCIPPLLLRFSISFAAFLLLHSPSPCLPSRSRACRPRLLSWLRALNHQHLQMPIATPVRPDLLCRLSTPRTHLLLLLLPMSPTSPGDSPLALSHPRRLCRFVLRLRLLRPQSPLQIPSRAKFPLSLLLPMSAQTRRPRLRQRLWRLHQPLRSW